MTPEIDMDLPTIHSCLGQDPSYRLALSVFLDSCRTVLQYPVVKDRWHALDSEVRENICDAIAWLVRTDTKWFYGYENLCEVFDIDPKRGRVHLLNKMQLTPFTAIRVLQQEGWVCGKVGARRKGARMNGRSRRS